MADYIVTSGELTTVANAIREKNGTSSSLSWPDGFVSGISSGGETWNTVFEGSVTTEAFDGISAGELPDLTTLSADTVKVTFNGNKYTCERKEEGGFTIYGASIGDDYFNDYPFRIKISPKRSELETPEAGTYSLKIEEPQSGGESDLVPLEFAYFPKTGRYMSIKTFGEIIADADSMNQCITFTSEYFSDGIPTQYTEGTTYRLIYADSLNNIADVRFVPTDRVYTVDEATITESGVNIANYLSIANRKK